MVRPYLSGFVESHWDSYHDLFMSGFKILRQVTEKWKWRRRDTAFNDAVFYSKLTRMPTNCDPRDSFLCAR